MQSTKRVRFDPERVKVYQGNVKNRIEKFPDDSLSTCPRAWENNA